MVVEYDESELNPKIYDDILKLWQQIKKSTLSEFLDTPTGLGFGGTEYKLKIENDLRTMTFEWRKFSSEETPFDKIIEKITKG